MNVKELTLTAAEIGETKLVQLIRRETKKIRANSAGASRVADLIEEVLSEVVHRDDGEGRENMRIT